MTKNSIWPFDYYSLIMWHIR